MKFASLPPQRTLARIAAPTVLPAVAARTATADAPARPGAPGVTLPRRSRPR